jgi:hypothetical protein
MKNIRTYNRSESKRSLVCRDGVTLIELMVAAAMSVIVMFGVAIMFYNGQKGWNNMYGRMYSDVVTNSYTAKKMFDSVVRKASINGFVLDEAAPSLEVHYYNDPNSSVADRYGKFYCQEKHLYFEYGILKLKEKEKVGTVPMCGNVSDCVFKENGRSMQMILTLDNGSQKNTTVTSAVMHNQ